MSVLSRPTLSTQSNASKERGGPRVRTVASLSDQNLEYRSNPGEGRGDIDPEHDHDLDYHDLHCSPRGDAPKPPRAANLSACGVGFRRTDSNRRSRTASVHHPRSRNASDGPRAVFGIPSQPTSAEVVDTAKPDASLASNRGSMDRHRTRRFPQILSCADRHRESIPFSPNCELRGFVLFDLFSPASALQRTEIIFYRTG